MTVRVVEPRLMKAVGAQSSAANADSGRLQTFDGRRAIVYLECKVKHATGRGLRRRVGQSGWSGFFVTQNQMDLCLSRLEPKSGETEIRSLGPLHSQEVDVEGGTALEIVND